MKRNHLSEGGDSRDEKEIIDRRLNELFSRSDEKFRQVQIYNKGTWNPHRGHISLESNKGLPCDMLSYSVEFKYHFLTPFEALLCVESRQLIIHFNGLPLSLAECYQVLLDNEVEFRNYMVFQRLNRSGHICLKHSCLGTTRELQVPECDKRAAQVMASPAKSKDEPLLKLDSIRLTMSQVLKSLQEFGPADADGVVVVGGANERTGGGDDCGCAEGKLVDDGSCGESVNITFDVYKRETFARNKPHKGKRGNPDYHVLVCQRSIRRHPPLAKQVLDMSRARGNLSGKLLFALVNDEDNSICFNQFKPVDSLDLVRLHG